MSAAERQRKHRERRRRGTVMRQVEVGEDVYAALAWARLLDERAAGDPEADAQALAAALRAWARMVFPLL